VCALWVRVFKISVRVLLVEDELIIRLVAAEVLHDEGFEVIEAADGAQAVRLIDGPDGFDLLLTDVQMPGPIDGIQVAIHARKRHPKIPVVVVSAQPINARRLDGLGPRKIFVSKPYELQALVATLWSMLKPGDAEQPGGTLA
jgi:CheY-like chemotaxis protein